MTRSSFTEELTSASYPGRLPGQIVSGWQSPSNIALIKYWGKRPGQLPISPSLSMTLENAYTQTILTATLGDSGRSNLIINNDPAHPFLPKLNIFLNWMIAEIPVLKNYQFSVSTQNSFPHSTGIASSASGLSAFTLCLLSFAAEAISLQIPQPHLMHQASFASRMGSGSACRSLFGGFVVWGKTEEISCASDLEALPINEVIHPDLHSFQDAILVISRKPKILSSSRGHETMNSHPFVAGRINQAKDHFSGMLKALKTGDLEQVGWLAEAEALSLHALLMSSPGGAVLLEPGTLEVIQKIRGARSHGLPVFFTLDAGPNVHLLYPEADRIAVNTFIEAELTPYCQDGFWIADRCGEGPREIREISLSTTFQV
ncbi:MAG: diphosphomevalonate decarboxylase [Bacteroidales bacterium]|nr:diphosphomevalonate decarboxylase [Bacteroidales bacterium]